MIPQLTLDSDRWTPDERRRVRVATTIHLIADLLNDARGLALADALLAVRQAAPDAATSQQAIRNLIEQRRDLPPSLEYLARRIVGLVLEPHADSQVADVLRAWHEVTR